MPSEVRQITFANNELRSALDDYLLRRNLPLPPGTISCMRWGGSDHAHIVFQVNDAMSDKSENATVATRHVGAAILRYCLVKRIPLPRNSRKLLAISGDNLMLELRSGEPKPIAEDAD